MKFIRSDIQDVYIFEPTVYEDERGCFLESYNYVNFNEAVGKTIFVQDNESKSKRGVIRGLHFQVPPYAQAKLVRCIEGAVIDVAVDIRKNSPTYGKHVALEITGDNKKQLYIPRGFAHGFAVISDEAIVAYKVDNVYSPEHDSGILWNDPDLNIDWKLINHEVVVSEKDKNLVNLKSFNSPFTY